MVFPLLKRNSTYERSKKTTPSPEHTSTLEDKK
jgi:hypothetical protein